MEYIHPQKRSDQKKALTNPTKITMPSNLGRNVQVSNSGPGTSTPGGQAEYKVNMPVNTITAKIDSGTVNSVITTGAVNISFNTNFTEAPKVFYKIDSATGESHAIVAETVSKSKVIGTLEDGGVTQTTATAIEWFAIGV